MDPLKQSLDKDLEKIVHVEAAARSLSGRLTAPSLALLFLGFSGLLALVISGFGNCRHSGGLYGAEYWRE